MEARRGVVFVLELIGNISTAFRLVLSLCFDMVAEGPFCVLVLLCRTGVFAYVARATPQGGVDDVLGSVCV